MTGSVWKDHDREVGFWQETGLPVCDDWGLIQELVASALTNDSGEIESPIESFVTNLQSICNASVQETDLCEALSQRVQQFTNATFVGILCATEKRWIAVSRDETSEKTAISPAVFDFCAQAVSGGELQVAVTEEGTLVYQPIDNQNSICLTAWFHSKQRFQQNERLVLRIGGLIAGSWFARRSCERAERHAAQVAAIVELVSRIEACPDIDQASSRMADELQKHLHSKQVVVGTCKSPKSACYVTGISNQNGFERDSELVVFSEAAMTECLARRAISCWPPTERSGRHALKAHQQLCERTHHDSLISIPLMDESLNDLGVILVLDDETRDEKRGDEKRGNPVRDKRFLHAAQTPIACSIALLKRSRKNRFQIFWQQIQKRIEKQQRSSILLACCVLTALMLCPVTYKVKCSCQLQPVGRQFVAAPFACRLEQTHVKPGDIVRENELLATLDGKEIKWELEQTKAQLHSAQKQLAGHIAMHEVGKAEIAKHEVERLMIKAEHWSNRNHNLEVRSPLHGIVVVGDHEKSEGMPLEIGQTLFEISPLERMTVEIAIPDADIRMVEPGMDAKIWLDSVPLRHWKARIERIHPRAERRDHENVFIADVTIENLESRLRPGMRGSVQIQTIRRPLAWNLFHKGVASGLAWMGW